jgi:methionyl-tRNA synthetase
MALPEQIVTNEFYRLEGDKFSTSRGHAIWGSDFLRRFDADALRYHLCLTGPEVEQTTFRMKDFTCTVDKFLVSRLEGWVQSLFQLLRDDFDCTTPDVRSDGGARAVRELLHTLPVSLARALEPGDFSLRSAAASLRDTVEVAEGSLRETRMQRMGGRTSRYAVDIADQVELLATLAVAASPIMPTWAEQLWRQLHVPPASGQGARLRWPEPEQRLTEPGQRLVATPVTTFGGI